MKKAFLLVAAVALLLTSGTLWVQSKGGVANALNLPPTLNARKASPAFTLLGTKNNVGDKYIVVKSPLVSRISKERKPMEFVTPADAFTATATDSMGRQWNLRWLLRPDEAQHSYSAPPLIYISRPDACPPDVKWYDVTLKSKWGQSAVWRVTNLQVARRFGQSDSIKPALTFNGITVSLTAHRFFPHNYSPKCPTLRSFLVARGTPTDGQDWRVRFESCTREWENPANILQFNATWADCKLTTHSMVTNMGLYWPDHYPQLNHYVRVTGSFALIQHTLAGEAVQRIIPFTLKTPIVFKTYTSPPPKPTPKKT